ncbi:MAG: porin family protein [Candidatus Azobacteroides sp.]|nr:porin family protein [Candidatus Azobacteroides sp.]
MKITSKIFIIFALMCVSAAAAYSQNSQDCNSYLKQATELRDKGDYCQAKQYYQMYQNCNADADVSTEIAMCENRIKLQSPGTNCPDYVPENGKSASSTQTSSNNRAGKSASSISRQGVKSEGKANSNIPVANGKGEETTARFKVGINGGVQLPMSNFGKEANMGYGGELNVKYMINENIGVGLGAGYYTFGIKKELLTESSNEFSTLYGYEINVKNGNYLMIPIVGKFSYVFGKNAFKPYLGVDLGLYMFGINIVADEGKDLEWLRKFGFAPVLGFEYAFTHSLGLDVNAKYHEILTDGSNGISSLSISVGIVYSF